LVAWDARAHTLTWYEDEPRVVKVKAEQPLGVEDQLYLVAIGPHDIAYMVSLATQGYLVAFGPSGTEITRTDWSPFGSQSQPGGPVFPTSAGLAGIQLDSDFEWPPSEALAMPWVDLDGNPIIDSRPYPTAKNTNAGIEVRLGERVWTPAGEASLRPVFLLPRSDGGVVMFNVQGQLLELSPDGTIERYDIGAIPLAMLPSAVMPDGSLIAIHNLQLVHLSPRA
jgi:hypothetical protein